MAEKCPSKGNKMEHGGGSWESNPPNEAFRPVPTGFEGRDQHQHGKTRRAVTIAGPDIAPRIYQSEPAPAVNPAAAKSAEPAAVVG